MKQKIKQSGLKQKYIADKIGMHPSSLSRCLNKSSPMSDEIKKKINKILKKHIEDRE